MPPKPTYEELEARLAELTNRAGRPDHAEDLETFRHAACLELFSHVPTGIAIYAVEGNGERFIFKDLNPAGERISQVSREEVVGKNVADAFPGVIDCGLLEVFQRVWRTGEPGHLAASYRDGRIEQAVENRVFRLPSGDIVALYSDVTRMDTALARQKLYAEILNILNGKDPWKVLLDRLISAIMDFSGFPAVGIRIRRGDDFPYLRSRGFSEDFLSRENSLCACGPGGKPILDEEGRPVLEGLCGNVLQGRADASQPFFTQVGSFWTNNSTRFLATTTEKERRGKTRNLCNALGYESLALIPLRVNGDIVGLLHLADKRQNRLSPDLVEFFEQVAASIGIALKRMEAEEALRESAEKLHAIVDNVGIGIALVSPGMEVLDVNRRMREWFPNVDPATRPLCHRVFNDPPRDAICSYCPTRQTLIDGQIHEAVTETPQAGGIRNYRIVSSAIRDATGKVVGAIEMVEDISERRQLEAQFLQAQKMEAVGRLAGGVAHDFNNMLGVISGYAELALDRLDEKDPIREDLAEILQASRRSADLTRQLLAFARRQNAVPRVVDVNRIIEQSGNMMRRLVGEDIEVQFTPAPETWRVRMDPSQVDQIMANLMVNARDAISGMGRIEIGIENVTVDEEYCRTHLDFSPGDYVMLSVDDNGAGMERDVLDRIFEPFFTTKGEGKGTGLGLSTVFGIVRQNNGVVNVYSKPGKGTTFHIFLPRHKGEEEDQPEEVEETLPRGRETILVVEDEEQILKLSQRILTHLGYRVLAARTPGDALVLCEKHAGPVDILITDVVMPAMNGRELSERVKAMKPGIRVLFMSGYTADVIAHNGVLAEGLPFIQKPFMQGPLARKVRSVLDA